MGGYLDLVYDRYVFDLSRIVAMNILWILHRARLL